MAADPRGSARARGYTAQWERAARLFKRAHPLCLGCEATGRVSAAEVVDHVIPHKGDQQLFWDQSRWQPACKWHHDVVKQQLEFMHARGAITERELWLSSPLACALTRRLRVAIGIDGWPVEGLGGCANFGA